MHSGLTLLFWFSIITILYTYVGFPLLIGLIGVIKNQKVHKRPITPSVSLIIAAYNEQDSIAKKLENCLALDYPADRLEIIVASDGSADDTNKIVKTFTHRGVILKDLPRRGKIFALHDAITDVENEILVFTDANTLFHTQALQKLASNFADPQVGGVCGNQVHAKSNTGDNTSNGEKLYWNYDKWLKRMQTATGSIVSADGAIYAIRRNLYKRPASSSTTDDFAISTGVIEQGYRLVFESDAIAYEEAAPQADKEFSRKVRIINRGLRGVILRKKLLNPSRYGVYSLILFSHKILRRLVPMFLIALLVSSIALSSDGYFYYGFAIAQTCFYILAIISYFLRNTLIGQSKILFIPFFYCLANIAALVAITKLILGRRIELWQPQR